jgi:hypothetical protein
VKITWEQLAAALEVASKTRIMFREDRLAYARVIAELRRESLAGRRCTGCGGPIMQRPIDLANPEGAVTFGYRCFCPGSEPLDESFDWKPVPFQRYEVEGGLEIPEGS